MLRPVIVATVWGRDNNWHRVEFLVDTGADRTVISAGAMNLLNLEYVHSVDRVNGVGGFVESVDVTTQIGLKRDDGQRITLRGTYAAFLEDNELDISILGRDILNLFAVIVDRGADRVMLLHGAHSYAIEHRQ
jgi:predicted aspartyl protease